MPDVLASILNPAFVDFRLVRSLCWWLNQCMYERRVSVTRRGIGMVRDGATCVSGVENSEFNSRDD